jgi:hypothetical protein
MQESKHPDRTGDDSVDEADHELTGDRRAGALKKPEQTAKAKPTPREQRLAAALRDNLRRRKAAQRKAED